MIDFVRVADPVLEMRWRGRLDQWLARQTGPTEQQLKHFDEQGILPLADWCGWQVAGLPELPAAAHAARQQLLAREVLHQQVVDALDHRLATAGIRALLLKGEALACTLYPARGLRSRHDLDLWVAPDDVATTERILADLAAVPQYSASGRWIQPERLWRVPAGRTHIGVDLHWQPISRPALLPALDRQRTFAASLPIPGCTALRHPDPETALLHSALHQWAHHRHGLRCIWRIDMFLLWEALSAGQHAAVVQRAVATGCAALLHKALQSIGLWLQPDPTLLATLARAADREPARRLVAEPPQPNWRFDLATTRGWQRLQVIGDYLLPDAQYVRQRYASAQVRWLPWLHLRRWLRW